jgi:putative GTP pyrophosphokinase
MFMLNPSYNSTTITFQSKRTITTIGKVLKTADPYSKAFDEACDAFDAYRNLFITPMHKVAKRCYSVLITSMKLKKKDYILAQRLKRLESVRIKLTNGTVNNLVTMGDIGGLRIILNDLDAVSTFQEAFCPKRRGHITLQDTKDYIQHPKANGYRSLHLQLQVVHNHDIFTALPIELQVRTKLQHAWATAVEVAGVIQNKHYKTGDWDANWEHFFQAASKVLAHKETHPKAQLPTDLLQALRHANQLETQTTALDTLKNASKACKSLTSPPPSKAKKVKKHDGQVMLVLQKRESGNPTENVWIWEADWKTVPKKPSLFGPSFVSFERNYEKHKKGMVLTIYLDDMKHLKEAYPNYFLDTQVFVSTLEALLSTAMA